MKREYRDDEIAFWDCNEDAETLYHESIDEAVDAYLDDLKKLDLDEEITVYGSVPMEIPDSQFEVLDDLLERLSEDFGNPDGDTVTPGMLAAEKAFIEAMKKEYKSWPCEQVKKVTVNCGEWVRVHRPEWLEEKMK